MRFNFFHLCDVQCTSNIGIIQLVEVAEKCAQYYANKGTIDHTCPDRIKINAGENLSWGSGFKFTPSEAVAFATERWYKESQYYDYNTGQQLEGTRNEFRHFTQVMWKDSKKLGMGYAKKQNGFYVVGLYLPPGNYEGRFKENVNPPSPGGAVLPLQGSDSSKCSPSTQSSSSVIRGQMGRGAGGICLALVMSAVLTIV